MKNIIFIGVIVILAILLFNIFTYTPENFETQSILDSSGNLIPIDATDVSNNFLKYNSDNYDVVYHSDPTDISSNYFNEPIKNMPSATYYQPGSKLYNPTTWVPNYGDSVYLSKLVEKSSPLYNTATQQAGICVQYANDPVRLEEQCNKLDKNVCGSTQCCVLLGGSKCVSGDKNGPTMKSNYSDLLIQNREYYYYNGVCYGNCQN
jgi:hypothetical protein